MQHFVCFIATENMSTITLDDMVMCCISDIGSKVICNAHEEGKPGDKAMWGVVG